MSIACDAVAHDNGARRQQSGLRHFGCLSRWNDSMDGAALGAGAAVHNKALLLTPQAFQGIYTYPVHHPYDRYSMVDLDRVDGDEWPGFAGVRGSTCILQPGDLLFVPQFWCARSILASAAGC